MEGTIVFGFPGEEKGKQGNSVGIQLIEIKKKGHMNHCVVFMKRKKGELLQV